MRRTSILVAAVAAGVLTLSSSREAHALGPVDLEIAAKAGYATNPSSGSTNPLGVGLGGRAGVSFFGFYGGVGIIDYLGANSEHALMYGFEAGYNWKIAILTIRPQVGVGNATFTAGSYNASNLYIEPGLTGLVSLGMLFVGADANLLVLPNINEGNNNKGTETAFTLHGQVGVRF